MEKAVLVPEPLILQLVSCEDDLKCFIPNTFVKRTIDAIVQIKQVLQDEMVGVRLNRPEPFVSEANAALYLNCSLSTLQKRRKAKLIGYIKKGRRIYYTKEALNRYLQDTTITVPGFSQQKIVLH